MGPRRRLFSSLADFFTPQFFRANYSHFLFAKIVLDSQWAFFATIPRVILHEDFSAKNFLLTLEHLWNEIFEPQRIFVISLGKCPEGNSNQQLNRRRWRLLPAAPHFVYFEGCWLIMMPGVVNGGLIVKLHAMALLLKLASL